MWTLMDSPIGPLRIVAQAGAITAIEFVDVPEAPAQLAGRPLGDRVDDDPLLLEAVRQLTAYFNRDLKEFDLPLAPVGTAFQRSVWDQLLTIGYGESASYGEIAGRLGKTGHGARAVGLANGRNPIPIVVPCHRVIGADGSITGYGGGIERKQILLNLETQSLF